jgi:hypothetical protein
MTPSTLPFDIRGLVSNERNQVAGELEDFTALFPATHRTASDDIVTPQPDNLTPFLSRELLIPRLDAIQSSLWLCGRPMPPRTLHQQVLMSRNITVTEQMELHLVWAKDRIFVKPVPAYLLDPDFWKTHLLSVGRGTDSNEKEEGQTSVLSNDLVACARGFLFSYTALIAYESDFAIARQVGLLPSTVTWSGWKTFSAQLLSSHCYSAVNPRFWYGELRLSRLNKVYMFRKGFLLRGYSSVGGHAFYVALLRDNFAVLAAVLGYVAIVLTAMQVGLATNQLQPNAMFQNASYGFTVFSILAPLIAAAGILGVVVLMVISNWGATKRYQTQRFQQMGVDPFWQAGQNTQH